MEIPARVGSLGPEMNNLISRLLSQPGTHLAETHHKHMIIWTLVGTPLLVSSTTGCLRKQAPTPVPRSIGQILEARLLHPHMLPVLPLYCLPENSQEVASVEEHLLKTEVFPQAPPHTSLPQGSDLETLVTAPPSAPQDPAATISFLTPVREEDAGLVFREGQEDTLPPACNPGLNRDRS